MSFQWLVVSTFLYTEIAICILLCLPFIQPKRWQYLFKSRLLAMFISYGNLCLAVSIAILCLLLADAIREVRKYSLPNAQQVDLKNNPNAQDHVLMMLFRSQRNLYISFFALFFLIIIWRLVKLISKEATLLAINEALEKQARSASQVAEAMMDSKKDSQKTKKKCDTDSESDDHEKIVAELKEKLEVAKKAEATAQNSLNAMKAQAEAVSKEYDRLMKEHEKLQKQVEGDGDKKSD